MDWTRRVARVGFVHGGFGHDPFEWRSSTTTSWWSSASPRCSRPSRDRVAVVELDSSLPVLQDVDVILYDTFGQVQGDGVDLPELVHGSDAKVAIFSWNVQPELVKRSIAQGASAYLSKALEGEALVDAIEQVHAGRVVVPAARRRRPSRSRATGRDASSV